MRCLEGEQKGVILLLVQRCYELVLLVLCEVEEAYISCVSFEMLQLYCSEVPRHKDVKIYHEFSLLRGEGFVKPEKQL